MTRRKTGISCFVSKAITESCVRDEWSEDTHDEGKNCYRTHQHIYNKKRRREKGEEEKFCEKNFLAWLMLMDLRNVLHVPFASRFPALSDFF